MPPLPIIYAYTSDWRIQRAPIDVVSGRKEPRDESKPGSRSCHSVPAHEAAMSLGQIMTGPVTPARRAAPKEQEDHPMSHHRFATGLFGVALFVLVDRKSTRLNSSHSQISYAVFC